MEVEKAIKNQKENFESALDKLQKSFIKLEHDPDNLEQYGHRLCVRLEDIPVEKDETADKVFRKGENI